MADPRTADDIRTAKENPKTATAAQMEAEAREGQAAQAERVRKMSTGIILEVHATKKEDESGVALITGTSYFDLNYAACMSLLNCLKEATYSITKKMAIAGLSQVLHKKPYEIIEMMRSGKSAEELMRDAENKPAPAE